MLLSSQRKSMLISHLRIKNWRNFRQAAVALRERQFLVGPNASGKSNFLDVFRFLRDIAKAEGGGLQKALKDRGGVSKVRCLAARTDPTIEIEVTFAENPGGPAIWIYALGIRQETRGLRQAQVAYEHVFRGSKKILNRPDPDDQKDSARLTQTYLEQINANESFRDIARFLQSITYLHLVPQLLRFADLFQGRVLEDDPFGQGFLERVAKTADKTRKARLRLIEKALQVAVPQLKQLEFTREPATGRPHLQALYSHWRPNAGLQREDQFSDGTLRLIGLLWSLVERDSLLLLEEPELSLNAGIVAQLAPLIFRMQRGRKRQVLISTHSAALLSDTGIDGQEVLLLAPGAEGTEVSLAADSSQVRQLLDAGLSVGEAVLPHTGVQNPEKLAVLE